MSYWPDKKVVVTGGAGFLGSHVVEALGEGGCRDVVAVRSQDYDLTKEENAIRLLEDTRPDIVFHLAGLVGGIAANKARPAEFFYHNLTMGTFMLHHSWRLGVKKLVAAGAGCGYPLTAPVPLNEDNLWDGLPQPETIPYSSVKRLLPIQASAYFEQYGFVSITGVLGNVYGPNHTFDLESSPVIPALIRKFVEATERGDPTVTVWGTGQPTRDFVYVGDVARALLLAAERYERPELVNISSGQETSIRALVEMLADLTGFKGQIEWDISRPDGARRRCLDISKARRDLGFEARTSLRRGLEKTTDWYKAHRASVRLSV